MYFGSSLHELKSPEAGACTLSRRYTDKKKWMCRDPVTSALSSILGGGFVRHEIVLFFEARIASQARSLIPMISGIHRTLQLEHG